MDAQMTNDIKVLVVDDNLPMREGIVELLKNKKGFHVVAQAENGEEAIRLSKEFGPDVILMDISMPQMDGLQATSLIKKDQPGIGIIALSMDDNESIRNKVMAAGASIFINKETSPKNLLQAIRKTC